MTNAPRTALVLYWSRTGNTAKVARAIEAGLRAGGMATTLCPVAQAGDLDFFDFDLVCLGFPSYNWHPPRAMDDYLKSKFEQYRHQGKVLPGAPRVPGRNALIFCTFSGPHTGLREAIPAGMYAAQFFEHLGFTVLDEWYVLSEFHGSEELSTKGRMGNIKGLPDDTELRRIEERARLLVLRL